MNFDFSGQTALVTGASQGIGRATAWLLALQGVRVAMAARRVALLDALRAQIVSQGGTEPVILEADLYPENGAERLARAATDALGRVDILVNSAGGSRPIGFDASKETWMEGLTLNFLRLRELTHALVPGMRAHGWGRVVNITGTSEPKALNAAFCAKAAVHVWAKGLSREVARDGVTVNCIQPGRIRSEQIARRYPTLEDELAFAKDEIPAGRFGEPEELAHLALFLASPLAGYITGTVIPVDGGMYRFAF